MKKSMIPIIAVVALAGLSALAQGGGGGGGGGGRGGRGGGAAGGGGGGPGGGGGGGGRGAGGPGGGGAAMAGGIRQAMGPGGAGAMMGGMMGGMQANWIEIRIMQADFMEKAGITQDQAEKLKAALKELDDAAQKINEEIRTLSNQQADLMLKVLSEAGANADELTQLTEKIGKLRTDQALLVNKRLFLIRDNLTAEQRKKVGELLQEERTNRMNRMQNRGQGGGGGGAPGAGGNANARQGAAPAAPQGW